MSKPAESPLMLNPLMSELPTRSVPAEIAISAHFAKMRRARTYKL
jgi:hypothetical protein